MSSLTVRDAEGRDAGGLLALYRQLGSSSTLPDVAETIRIISVMAYDPGVHLLVAESGSEIVGTATIAVVPNITHDARPWAQIENMVVLDTHRRQGVGEALIERCEDITRAANGYKMQLISSNPRVEAHAFYQSVGFNPGHRGFRKYF